MGLRAYAFFLDRRRGWIVAIGEDSDGAPAYFTHEGAAEVAKLITRALATGEEMSRTMGRSEESEGR